MKGKMREIKFRGLSVNGDWSYGLLAKTENKKVACGDTGSFISNKAGCAFAYQVRPETVGQFTGLLDKNGKEIYEGDIIDYTGSEIPGDEHNIEPVEWNEDYPGWILGSYAMGLNEFFKDELEVIGNIYEKAKHYERRR